MRPLIFILLASILSGCGQESAPDPVPLLSYAQLPLVQWKSAEPMNVARALHTAIPLSDGTLLVAGGEQNGVFWPTSKSERFDPTSNSWTLSPNWMNEYRIGHTTTLLAGGQVLVVGGTLKSTVPEVYNPLLDTWSVMPPLSQLRIGHTATLLPNGKVLVAGGEDGPVNPALPIQPSFWGGPSSLVISSIEIYDPPKKAWFSIKSLLQARSGHTATLLPSGRLLIVGGISAAAGMIDPSVIAELYDPTTEASIYGAPLAEAVINHTATLLADGRVLIAGGDDVYLGDRTAAAALYSPSANVWTPAAPMFMARSKHTATLLKDGRVLIAGGSDSAATEIYDPSGDFWLLAGVMDSPRESAAMALAGDNVLITGGFGPNQGMALASADLLTGIADFGESCSSPNDCLSGFCANGICCNTPCDGICEACGGGTCKPLSGVACDDNNPCTLTDTCKAGLCVGDDPVICSAPDACHDAVCQPSTGKCEVLLKDGVNDCASLPPPQATLGVQTCYSNSDCDAGSYCVDGVCCDSPCTETCYSCALPGSPGTCTPEPIGVDLRHDCGPAANCLSTCSGMGTCIGAGPGTLCRPAECAEDGVRGSGPALCPSVGAACPEDRVPFSCAPYRCVAALGICSEGCVSVSDCAPPYVCDPSNRCVTPPDKSIGNECASVPGQPGSRGIGAALLLASAALAFHARSRGQRVQ